ncbi:MAG TPA: mercuric reductase [Candidatus Melainabacteria bacterium]|nr:mercuric reductase [Candidatus Melainabacteria bacterium]
MAAVEQFDYLIVGGGKGGKSLAMALGPAGKKVALVEEGQIGGTCINVACIPTKTMVASAKLLHHVHHADQFGLSVGEVGKGVKGVIERKRRVVKGMVDTHKQLFSSTPNMEFILGAAKFIDYKVIEVSTIEGGTRKLTADRIVINTGSAPMVPNTPGLAESGFLTNATIMELEELPTHLSILGGGYIALEFAQIFKRLGSEVTVLLRTDRFLPKEDEDIAAAIKDVLEKEGIRFISGVEVSSVSRSGKTAKLLLKRGDAEEVLECSHILVATGRVANNAKLQTEATGVKLDKRGYIEVSEYLETSAEDIWAIGDCNGGPHFTHVSWDDYRILRDLFLHNKKRSTNGRLVPYTLFVDPELGRVGLTEQDARKAGHDILIAKMPAVKVPRAVTAGETRGLLKAVIDKKTGHILGCSIFAHEGGEIMSVVQAAMLGKLHYEEVRDAVWTHPTMAESLNLLLATIV